MKPAHAATKPRATRTPADKAPTARPQSSRRVPRNTADFEFSKRRFREAQHRLAHARGDYLDTGLEPVKRVSTYKFRPGALANVKLSIGPAALNTIVHLTQIEDGDRETGGALIGTVTGGTVRVVHATGPGTDAEQTATSVRTRVTQADIDAVIAASKANLTEIGSWHAHPHGLGEPSKTDLESLIADREVLGIPNPVMLIARPSLTSRWANPVPAAWMLTTSDIDGYDFDIRSVDLTQ